MEYVAAAVLGFLGGMLGGLVGVGGGVLFVPALVIFLDMAQVKAQSTSLFAIIFVAAIGAYRQYGYGNVRLRDGLVLGTFGLGGVIVGGVIANTVSGRTLELMFAAMALVIAAQLVRRAFKPARAAPKGRAPEPP